MVDDLVTKSAARRLLQLMPLLRWCWLLLTWLRNQWPAVMASSCTPSKAKAFECTQPSLCTVVRGAALAHHSKKVVAGEPEAW